VNEFAKKEDSSIFELMPKHVRPVDLISLFRDRDERFVEVALFLLFEMSDSRNCKSGCVIVSQDFEPFPLFTQQTGIP
jgi:hypothetical protein